VMFVKFVIAYPLPFFMFSSPHTPLFSRLKSPGLAKPAGAHARGVGKKWNE
jgi:hypothetical protein